MRQLLQCLADVVVLSVCVLSISCSSSGYYYDKSNYWVPTHIDRTYAAYSEPAVDTDGSIYVIHGNMLLHYSSSHELLGQTQVLPAESRGFEALRTDLSIDDVGRCYIATGTEVKILAPDHSLIGKQDVMEYIQGSLTVFDDGAFITYKKDNYWYYAGFMSDMGDMEWEVRLTDQYAITCVCSRDLFVLEYSNVFLALDGSGAKLYETTIEDTPPYEVISVSAAGNLVAVTTLKGLLLYENGDLKWFKANLSEYGYFRSVLIPSNDRIIACFQGGDSVDSSTIYAYNVADGLMIQLESHDIPFKLMPYTSSEILVFGMTDFGSNLSSVNSTDGSYNWTIKHKPESYEAIVEENQVIERYYSSTQPTINPNGGLFMVENGTLEQFDANGHVIWEQPPTIYSDELVAGHYSFPE